MAALLLQLAEGRVDLQQALDDLNDEQRGLRDDNAKLHEAIADAHAGLSANTASDWQFLEKPRDVFGRWWDQAKPQSTEGLSDTVGVTSAAEFGKQFVEQWQQLGQRVSSHFGSSVFQVAHNVTEADLPQDGVKLGRLVLDEVYRSVGRRLQVAEPEEEKEAVAAQEEAATQDVKVAANDQLAQRTGIADALWAVTLHWQHFGAPDRASGPCQQRLAQCGQATCQPLERVVLDEVYRRVSQKPPTPSLADQVLGNETEDDSVDTDVEDKDQQDASPLGFGSPHHLGMQLVDQWQQWGKRVNEHLSDYVAQGSLGWQTFKQALGEPDLAKSKKKAKKVKKEKSPQAEEEAGVAFSRVLLQAHIKLGDGSIETLDVRTNEQFKEVVSRFVRRHYLDSCLKKPLKAYLRHALNNAASLPVELEVDLCEIEGFCSK